MHNKWLRVAMSLYMKLPLLIFSSSSFIRGWFFLCSVYPFFFKTHAKKWKKNLNVTATTIIAQKRELYVREGEKKKNLSCFFFIPFSIRNGMNFTWKLFWWFASWLRMCFECNFVYHLPQFSIYKCLNAHEPSYKCS